jgi:hypothetical protein
MSGVCLEVPPLSAAAIARMASEVRQGFGLVEDCLPIVSVLEFGLATIWPEYTFEVADITEMPGEEGLTYPDEKRIVLREDVYERAIEGNGRARFTCAHELGHLLMHANLGFARHIERGSIPAYRDSEWQANTFAGELLIPRGSVAPGDKVFEVASRFGVSLEAAEVTLKRYGHAFVH